MAAMLGKMLINVGMSLLTEKFIKEMVIWALETGAAGTKFKWDDKLVEIVKENME